MNAAVEPGPSGDAKPAASPTPVAAHWQGILQASQSLINVVVVALFIITFTAQPFRIPSASMEPTLLVGDFLLVNKNAPIDHGIGGLAPSNRIHRGDLIVFHYPVDPSLHLVKRVVGLPGDRIRLRAGRVMLDGSAVSEPFAVFRPSVPDSYRDNFPRMDNVDPGVNPRWWIQMRSLISGGELTVPADSYFVLGDNRNDSEDSRYWGFVPQSAIVGKPFLIYFSLRNLDDPPGQAAGPHSWRLGSLVDFARWDRALRVIH